MTTELIATQNKMINYSDPEVLATLKQTVAKGASDTEFTMFTEFCRATGLNPFKKEVWFIKTNAGVQMMTGINGFYEIANRHPQFDGIEVETVENGKDIQKCVAKVYRKDRSRPTIAEAYWSEYAKNFGNWKTMPRLMLSKCAESMALRKAFPQELNGLYTQEEMPAEYARLPQIDNAKEQTAAIDIETQQRQNYLKQQAAKLAKTESTGEYIFEFGSEKGRPLAFCANGIFLKKHLEKYKDQLSPVAVQAIEMRLTELRREYAQTQERLRQAQQDAAEQGDSLTEEEKAEILAEEAQAEA